MESQSFRMKIGYDVLKFSLWLLKLRVLAYTVLATGTLMVIVFLKSLACGFGLAFRVGALGISRLCS